MLKKVAKHPGFNLSLAHLFYVYEWQTYSAATTGRLTSLFSRKNVVKACMVAVLGIASLYTIAFFWPHQVDFVYSNNACITSPALFPGMVSRGGGKVFTSVAEPTFQVAGHTVYSHRACIKPVAAPKPGVQEKLSLSVFLAPYLSKSITITAGAMPALQNQAMLEKPISPAKPLELAFDSADQVFDYRLTVGDSKVACTKDDEMVACDIAKLELAQSAGYRLTLERLFKGKPTETVFSKAVTTVEAMHVTGASINPGQTVYNVPADLVLTFNKPLATAEEVTLSAVSGGSRQAVAATVKADGTTITLTFGAPLARSTTFELVAENITAEDGAYLDAPFTMQFLTSGGPKVLGVSIGSYKVATSAAITLTFDTELSANQAASDFVSLAAGGSAVAASIKTSGNTIKITPSSELPRCTPLQVTVRGGLQNSYGVSGSSSWNYKSRTICQTVFSIGTSVQGRAITAYRFGGGASRIIYVGGTHGNEKSSVYTLNKWVDYLEANYDRVPANRTIVVIPNLNPDGFAANRRTNANNVDLNRNFPANDWKQGVTMPDQTYNANGGGSAPLSEPESSALANYVLGQDPRLVLTYHAAASVVIPNDSGDSVALAHTYDQKSNVGFASNGETDTIFEYDTTGAFEDWLHDKHDITALLIELSTKTSSEFSGHQNAMWAMAQLP